MRWVKYTEQEEQEIVRLKAMGLKTDEIAARVGRSNKAISKKLTMIKQEQGIATHKYLPYNHTDEVLMMVMHESGKSDQEIAEKLHREPHAIHKKIHDLKLRAERMRNGEESGLTRLCGDCGMWQAEAERRRNGRRYGVCCQTRKTTERCQGCTLKW